KVSLEILGADGSSVASSDTAKNKNVAAFTKNAANCERWNIQLGAFSSRKNAELFAADAQAAGLKHLAFQTTKSGITRLIIKDLPTDKVQPTLNALEKKGFKDYLVRERHD
ncbi:MAG: SPOR domain-containing protein, partial [Treponema sp.]|nr:SPOR domain-containing protein [Treponema sp.]